MGEIIRDPLWQFVGVVLAAAAIAVAVAVYLLQRRRKALSYEVISQTPLVKLENHRESALQILYDGQPAEDVHMIVVRVVNSGNTPIAGDDYERPVTWSFGPHARLLTAEVLSSDPESLGRMGGVTYGSETAQLRSMLFNSGDSITLKFLVADFQGDIVVDGRIEGVRRIERQEKGGISLRLYLSWVALFAGGMLWSRLANRATEERFEVAFNFFVDLSVLVLGCIWLTYSFRSMYPRWRSFLRRSS